MDTKMDWVKDSEKVSKDGYFTMAEGDNRVQLLSHCAPLALKWNGSTYEAAVEGDTNVSIKGVCWVLQDGVIKLAKLPYTVVKAIKELMQDEDYAFDEFPMPRSVNIKARNAGTKEVEYSVVPSPKETPVAKEIMDELSKKPTPEEMVEKEKNRGVSPVKKEEDELDPKSIPF